MVAGASRGFHTSGGLAGGQVGYLYQAAPGQAIVGLDVAFDWSNLKGSANSGLTTYPVPPPTGFSWNLAAKSQSLFTAVVRLGPDLGMWFPYVSAGASTTHLSYTANYIDTFYPSVSDNSFSKDAAGWVIGAGAEFRVAEHWLLRGEYLHTEFGSISGFGQIACTAGVGNCVGAGFRTTFQFGSRFTQDVGARRSQLQVLICDRIASAKARGSRLGLWHVSYWPKASLGVTQRSGRNRGRSKRRAWSRKVEAGFRIRSCSKQRKLDCDPIQFELDHSLGGSAKRNPPFNGQS